MKIAIITGVSKGIGLALSLAFLEENWKVIGIGRSTTINHPNFEFKSCDLLDPKQIEALSFDLSGYNQCVLINNAGVLGTIKRISDQEIFESASIFQVNVLAPIRLMQKFAILCSDIIPLTILNISSGAGRRPIPSWANYCATKAALDSFSQSFQQEEIEKRRKTRVFALAPGVVDTQMQTTIRKVSEQDFSSKQKFVDLYNDKQLITTDVIAQKIMAFLKSNEQQEVVCALH